MLVRYPGGKAKLAERIVSAIDSFYKKNPDRDIQYREPFFGAGAIGLRLLQKNYIKRAWFNDLDPGIFNLWAAVAICPDFLLNRIDSFTPSTDRFYEYKEYLKSLTPDNGHPPVLEEKADIGFKKLAVHQLSYSGLGTMSGGPLGGVDQKSSYKIDCRWSPKQLRKEINRIHRLIASKRVPDVEFGLREGVTLTSLSYIELLAGATADCFTYLDPPYYVKGPELYQFSFSLADHERLAQVLHLTPSPWLLSYDDCPEIRNLYGFAAVREVPLNYTINGAITKTELLIAPKEYEYLLEQRSSRSGRTFDIFEDELA